MTEAKSKFNAEQYLIELKGKDYLPVNRRIQWFRHDHPDGLIRTKMLYNGPDGAGFQCILFDSDSNEVAHGHGFANSEIAKMGRVWEKAETAAIGRALAHAGYGTQFTGQDDDLDSDKALADAPIDNYEPQNDVHWIDSDTARKRFWAWTKDTLALTKAEVYEALGVARIHDYPGTMGDAKSDIESYLDEVQE